MPGNVAVSRTEPRVKSGVTGYDCLLLAISLALHLLALFRLVFERLFARLARLFEALVGDVVLVVIAQQASFVTVARTLATGNP